MFELFFVLLESLWELYLDTCLEIAKVVSSSKRKEMVSFSLE